jgi:N-acetylmuramoyl-L-alanine amidase
MVSFVFCETTVVAASSAQEMYLTAMAREENVRAALAPEGGNVPASVAADMRAVVAAYQEIVRLYPASGYSDDALWQAGGLSIDAFLRFGQPRDRNTGVRLLQWLKTEYPTSRHVKEVPGQLARADAASAGGPQATSPLASAAGTAPQDGRKGPTAPLATIKAIRREVLGDAVRITIELDREVTFHDERLPDPTRVFVDLPATRYASSLADKTMRFDGDNDVVRQIRLGRHPNATTRVVLEAAGVSSYSVYALYNPYRLVIDCVRDVPKALAASSPSPSFDKLRAGGPAEPPLPASAGPARSASDVPPLQASPVPVTAVGNGLETVPTPQTFPAAPTPAATAAPPPLPARDALPPLTSTSAPPRNVGGGYSMARQLGLSVSRIVIDPGHGGHDPGAIGKSITEAELVLDIALRVEALLRKIPGTEVILTRRTDEFVALQDRTAIANREGADLFLSIHANASANSSARGVETYFLNFASNMTAASVAARENAASGQAMGALPDFLKAIALNNKLDESRDFATDVQNAIVKRLRRSNKAVKDLGVKQAPFVVLIGAAMPSVLTEISFVTNAPEAKLLRNSAYRQRIAEALADAIEKYQKSLKNDTIAKQ